jgi:hypothetical protein
MLAGNTMHLPNPSVPLFYRGAPPTEGAAATPQYEAAPDDCTRTVVVFTAKAPPKLYNIRVASHLTPEWEEAEGVVSITNSYTDAGAPVTTLVVEATDQADLISLLNRLHCENRAICWLEIMREA